MTNLLTSCMFHWQFPALNSSWHPIYKVRDLIRGQWTVQLPTPLDIDLYIKVSGEAIDWEVRTQGSLFVASLTLASISV